MAEVLSREGNVMTEWTESRPMRTKYPGVMTVFEERCRYVSRRFRAVLNGLFHGGALPFSSYVHDARKGQGVMCY